MAKHFDELNALLGLLNLNFSVIGISETRFLKNSPPIFDFDIGGYTAVHTPTESSAGGALLYISNYLYYFPRSDLDDVLYKPKELESVFVEVSFSNKPNCIVGCIYKHPGMSVNTFTAEFLSPFLQLVSKENKSIVLLGDFNINLLNFDNSTEVGTFIDTLESYSLLPQVTLPTRITETSQTLIDNIFTTSIDRKCLVMFCTLFLTTFLNFFVFLLHLLLVMVVKICQTSIRIGHNSKARNLAVFSSVLIGEKF